MAIPLASCSVETASPLDRKAIAEEGFVYGLPISVLAPGEGTWQPPAVEVAD